MVWEPPFGGLPEPDAVPVTGPKLPVVPLEDPEDPTVLPEVGGLRAGGGGGGGP